MRPFVDISTNASLEVRDIPFYPRPTRPYTVGALRMSRNFRTVEGNTHAKFEAWFAKREMVQKEHHLVFISADDIMSVYFEAASFIFPLLPGPQVNKYYNLCNDQIRNGNDSRLGSIIIKSMSATVHICDLLAQHPTASMPVLMTYADGFACEFSAMALFCITVRPFWFDIKWQAAHLRRSELQIGSPGFTAWNASGILMFDIDNRDIWVRVGSRPLALAILEQWKAKRDGRQWRCPMLEPLLRLLAGRQV